MIGDIHSLAGQAAPPGSLVCDTPTVTITGHPTDPTNQTSAEFTFTTDDPSSPATPLTTTCSLDGAPATTCHSPVVYSQLADGAHVFTVRAGDPAGNSASASFGFVVDATPPACTAGRIVHRLPPRQAQIAVSDGGTGLQSITNIRAQNATVTVGPFTRGTTSPVLVTATKTHGTILGALLFDLTGFALEPTSWSFDASDLAGNTIHCTNTFG